MKKNVMAKNLLLTIGHSIGRYIAILAIIALGAGLFVGLLSSKTDIVATAHQFVNDQNMFDFRILNPYGWTQEEVDAVNALPEVDSAEGLNTLDVIARLGQEAEDSVFQLYSLPNTVNRPMLLGGRMPEKDNECLLDGFGVNDSVLGKRLSISRENEQDVFDSLYVTEYTVVGYVSTPLFMDMNRGNTSLGNGTISAYVYVPKGAISAEYYTEIAVSVFCEYDAYSEEYENAIDSLEAVLEPEFKQLAQYRYDSIYQEAMDEYSDGFAEYMDGVEEYVDAVDEVNRELADAEAELKDAEKEIKDNKKKVADGEKQISDGWDTLRKNEKDLKEGKSTLNAEKKKAYAKLDAAEKELDSNKKTVKENLKSVKDGISQIQQGLEQLNPGISSLESGLAELDGNLTVLNEQASGLQMIIGQLQTQLDAAIASDASQEEIDALSAELATNNASYEQINSTIESLEQQKIQYEQQLSQLKNQREDLENQLSSLESNQTQLEQALKTINDGYAALKKSRKEADSEFKKAEQKLAKAQSQLDSAESTLKKKELELKEAKEKIADGEKKLVEGWDDFYDGKADAEEELAEAKNELEEGYQELRDAKDEIDDLPKAELYMLNRSTNVGYLSVESNANIVAGVSRVFPIFFLLVASLVCITTMTRMVAEERTQIGTLKSLGYSNFAIIGKYIFYAGSAAVIGCGIGCTLGCTVFPQIIWLGYKIMLNIKPDLELIWDIPLCLIVTIVYTVVIIAVTWYSCRLALREEPASLIRPKANTSGKKILLEYLPGWSKIRFLNKVMLRNIFRYRQRLLMMLVGVGGCTALLVTGFGVGDSIMDIVSYQFQEVTLYDLQVQFSEGQSIENRIIFEKEMSDNVDDITFVHQSSVDISFDGGTRSINLIAPSEDLDGFFDLHSGAESVEMPKKNEAILSIGTAEILGIQKGDMITVRNSDLQELSVQITDIFDNNVYNYIILSPETITGQWGEEPEYQMAYMTVPDGVDAHEIGAAVSANDDVMNVLVSQDLADQVGAMLEAMNLIIVTIVICAGLLAIIVTYNLTNINITERIREIATIKVLGFRAGESAAYVFKENLLLSAMGAVLGLGLGKLLLDFVMSQIVIDMVWFQSRISPDSLWWSIGITMLMALVVDFLLYFKLEKINMAEALKSVE